MSDRWYVVQTKNRCEQFAVDNLVAQGYRVFYPAYRKTVLKGKKRFENTLPLYPSYLFVCFDIEKDHWRSIFGTRGVVTILSSAEDSASPLPVGFVEAMIDALDKNGFVDLSTSVEALVQYAPGTKLRVKDSAFNGLVGVCLESTANRISLFLSLLSSRIKVNLPLSAVEPA